MPGRWKQTVCNYSIHSQDIGYSHVPQSAVTIDHNDVEVRGKWAVVFFVGTKPPVHCAGEAILTAVSEMENQAG